MMNVNIYDTELFPYLEGEALVGSALKLTIRDFKFEEMIAHGGKKETKPVLYFRENKKGFVLNKTNAKTIAVLFGSETGQWEGKQITLYTEEVQAFGATYNALRVAPTKPGDGGTTVPGLVFSGTDATTGPPWIDLSPSRGDFFTHARDDLGLSPEVAAQMLKAEGFTNGYGPEVAPDMWKVLLSAPMPRAEAEQLKAEGAAEAEAAEAAPSEMSAMDEVEAEEDAQMMIDSGQVDTNGPDMHDGPID